MRLLLQIVLVSFGSVLGGLLRWGVSVAFARWCGLAFPWGTLFINLSGSCFLGWFATMLSERFVLPEGSWLHAHDLRLFVALGFTGSYTTFSTFELETHKLLDDKLNWLALLYVAASVVLGLLAVRGGVWLARWH